MPSSRFTHRLFFTPLLFSSTNLIWLPSSKIKADLVEASAKCLRFIPKGKMSGCLHISFASRMSSPQSSLVSLGSNACLS